MKEKAKIIISVIITVIVMLTLTVTASLVTNATNITYTSDKTNKTNVSDSLDELYDIVGNSDTSWQESIDWILGGNKGDSISVTVGKKYIVMMASSSSTTPTITGGQIIKDPIFYFYNNYSLGLAIVEATSDTIKFSNNNTKTVIAYYDLTNVIRMSGKVPENYGIVFNKAVPTTIGKVYLVVNSESHCGGEKSTLTNGNFFNSNQNMVYYDSWLGLNFAIVKATSDSLIYKNRTEDVTVANSYMGYVELF